MKRKIFLLLLATSVVGGALYSFAYPPFLTLFNLTYGTEATALNTCLLCHSGPTPDLNPADIPRNPFGLDFANPFIGNHSFNVALEGRDSDGDGVINIAEIQARTFPGNPNSRPWM